MVTAAVTELELILGRPVWDIPVEEPLSRLAGRRILVTGAAGSVGAVLVPLLRAAGVRVYAGDVAEMDVLDPTMLRWWFAREQPEIVFHLAGAKHAPDGERDPAAVMETNVFGTQNVLRLAVEHAARVVLASTCKACDPETVYGASKLIAERMVLNTAGSVARFYNVVETSGNVFETWRGLPDDEAVPATHCERYFIALEEAVALLVWAAVLPAGRYGVSPGERRLMMDVADALYPGRPVVAVPARRGDRRREPLLGSSEHAAACLDAPAELMRITSPHEAVAA